MRAVFQVGPREELFQQRFVFTRVVFLPGLDGGLAGRDRADTVQLGKLRAALSREQFVRDFSEGRLHIVVVEHMRHGAHRERSAAQIADFKPAALQTLRIFQKRAFFPLAQQERPRQQ